MVVLLIYNLMLGIYNPTNKVLKISLGITTIILLGSGFTLLKRFGISHSGPYPMWIWAKIGCWFSLAIIPPVLIKRAPNVAKKSSIILIAIILIAIFMGVYKPQ